MGQLAIGVMEAADEDGTGNVLSSEPSLVACALRWIRGFLRRVMVAGPGTVQRLESFRTGSPPQTDGNPTGDINLGEIRAA